MIFDLKIELPISQENGKSEKKGGKEQLSHYNRQSRRNQSTTFFILDMIMEFYFIFLFFKQDHIYKREAVNEDRFEGL